MSPAPPSGLSAALSTVLAVSGISANTVTEALTAAVHDYAAKVGLGGVEVTVSPVVHGRVTVSAPPAAAQWLRLDVDGLAAAVRAVDGVASDVRVRVRRSGVR